MSADDFFGGGNPSAKFPTPGTTVAGVITRVGDVMQQTDFATKQVKTYDNGDPMMQLPIDVQTDERDPAVLNDSGVRTIYVKGQMQKAFRQALRQAGAPGPRVGGRLSVTYTGDGRAERGNPPKLYSVSYTAPAAGDGFFAGQPAAPAVPAQQVAPQAQPQSAGRPPWADAAPASVGAPASGNGAW